jgi:hypothetical protein
LDANCGPVFAALIAPGIIDAINTGQISLDQFLHSNMALTWIPAIAAWYAPFPFLGLTVNARLLFPDGSGNVQFASSGCTLAAMADLDMMPLVSWMPIGLSGIYSITSPLGGRLATTQDTGSGSSTPGSGRWPPGSRSTGGWGGWPPIKWPNPRWPG